MCLVYLVALPESFEFLCLMDTELSLDLNKCGLDSGSVAINIQSGFWQQIADT